MRVFLLVLAAAAAATAAAPKTLPTSWPICKKTDPNVGDCISKAVAMAVEDLSTKGAKEFGIFPIDPLLISQVQIGQGKGPVSIDLQFSDLNIYGLRSAKVGKVSADIDKFHFAAPITIKDPIILKGKYKINGKVLVLPINGEGDCDLVLSNVTAKLDLQGKELKKDNQKYMDVEGFKFTFETTGMKIRLDNLFNGNKQLSDNMNKFLNENWPVILNELKPGIQDAFGAAFGDISNRIFHKVPYNKIFP